MRTKASYLFASSDPAIEKIRKAIRDIYDDLSKLQAVENITSLPTACEDNRGRTILARRGDGVADAVAVCKKNDSDGYEWVVLTGTTVLTGAMIP